MTRRPLIGRAMVLVLLGALLGMCLAEVAHAAMPSAAPMDCAARVCDVTGCEPRSAVLVHLTTALAVVPETGSVSAPGARATLAAGAPPSPSSRLLVRSSAPRSPPLV